MVAVMGTETEYASHLYHPKYRFKQNPAFFAPRVIWAATHNDFNFCLESGFESPTRDLRGSQFGPDVDEEEQQLALHGREVIDFLESVSGCFDAITENPDEWLPNGARLYVDMGHVELSTGLCTSAREALIHMKAGEYWVNYGRQEFTEELRSMQHPSIEDMQNIDFRIYANNMDWYWHSWGHHENYLIPRQLNLDYLIDTLVPFLVVRQLFSGSGSLGESGQFVMSQRSKFVETKVATQTTVRRPIFNTRDEPHAAQEKYRRLHVIVGDRNMSEVSAYMRLGLTSLVLDAIIAEKILKSDVALKWPVLEIKSLNFGTDDFGHDTRLELEKGQMISACELLEVYYDAISSVHSASQDPETNDLIRRFGETIQALKDGDENYLRGKVDWVAKRSLIHRIRKKYPEIEPEALRSYDLLYHSIDPATSWFYKMQEKGIMERIITDDEIEAAVMEPPQGTRSYLFGKCISKFKPDISFINWDGITFHRGATLKLEEPLQGSKAQVESLLSQANTPEQLINLLGSLEKKDETSGRYVQEVRL